MIDQIRLLLTNNKNDICGVGETFLGNDVSNNELNIEGPYSKKVLRAYAYRKSLLNLWLVYQKCSNSSSVAKTGATFRILKHGVR